MKQVYEKHVEATGTVKGKVRATCKTVKAQNSSRQSLGKLLVNVICTHGVHGSRHSEEFNSSLRAQQATNRKIPEGCKSSDRATFQTHSMQGEVPEMGRSRVLSSIRGMPVIKLRGGYPTIGTKPWRPRTGIYKRDHLAVKINTH